MKCPRRRSSSGWRRQPAAQNVRSAAPNRIRTTSRRSPRLRVLRSFSNSTRDFSDSLTICNYNLPSTINTWFRLKFCRRKAALIVFTRHSTHSRSPRRCACYTHSSIHPCRSRMQNLRAPHSTAIPTRSLALLLLCIMLHVRSLQIDNYSLQFHLADPTDKYVYQ